MINIKFRTVINSKTGRELWGFSQIIHNKIMFINCFIFCFYNTEIMLQEAPWKLHPYSLIIKREKKKFFPSSSR